MLKTLSNTVSIGTLNILKSLMFKILLHLKFMDCQILIDSLEV